MSKKKPHGNSKYREEFAEQAKKLCLMGATNPKLADFFNVSSPTIDDWIRSNKAFGDAVKEGRMVADAEIASSLYHKAKGYSHPDVHISNYQGDITITEITKHYPPDTTAAKYWLTNRQPDLWREGIELTGKGGGPIETKSTDDVMLARKLAYLLTKGAEDAEDAQEQEA